VSCTSPLTSYPLLYFHLQSVHCTVFPPDVHSVVLCTVYSVLNLCRKKHFNLMLVFPSPLFKPNRLFSSAHDLLFLHLSSALCYDMLFILPQRWSQFTVVSCSQASHSSERCGRQVDDRLTRPRVKESLSCERFLVRAVASRGLWSFLMFWRERREVQPRLYCSGRLYLHH